MIGPVQGFSGYPDIRVSGYQGKEKVKQEFLAIFYKELLKQVFKAPDLNPGEEDKGNDLVSSFSSDLMVEQLAEQMAKKASIGPQWLTPSGEGK